MHEPNCFLCNFNRCSSAQLMLEGLISIDNIISIDLDVCFRYILDIICVCNIVNSGLVFSPCR